MPQMNNTFDTETIALHQINHHDYGKILSIFSAALGGLALIIWGISLTGLLGNVLVFAGSLFLLAGYTSFCACYPTQSLYVVVAFAMLQGLVKQILNWSIPSYIAMDFSWVLFLIVWVTKRLLCWKPIPGSALNFVIVLFVAWSVVQIANPSLSTPAMALSAFRARLLPLLFFCVGWDLLKAKYARLLILFVIVLGGIASIFGIYEWLIGLSGVSSWGPGFVPKSSTAWFGSDGGVLRPFSIYQDGILAATFTGFLLVICAGSISSWSPKQKFLVGTAAVCCGIFIGVSGVRTALLRTGLSLLASLIYCGRRALPGVLAVALAVMIFVPIGWDKMQERYAGISNPLNAYTQNRGQTVTVASEFAWNNPLGSGTGSATDASEIIATLFGSHGVVKAAVYDNGYGSIVAEGGFPLLILYILILLCVLKNSWENRRSSSDAFFLGYVSFSSTIFLLVWSFASPPLDFQPMNIIYWTIVGSFTAMRHREIQQRRHETS